MNECPDPIPTLDDDPFSEETLASPRAYQQRLRDAGPLVWLSRYGFYAVGCYEEAGQVLSDWRQYSSARGVGTVDLASQAPWWGERAVLIESDPPRHNEIRAQVLKVLNPRSVADLAPEFRRQAEVLLDRVLPLGTFDAQADIANAYPLKVFGDALGIDEENRELLLVIGDMGFNNFGPDNAVQQQSMKIGAELGAVEWMKARTRKDAVRDGSFGAQFHALSESGDLTADEAWNVMRGQLAAGVDTTIAALGYAIYCFAKFPEQYQKLRDDPSLARNAFEEAIRLLSPIQCILRTTTGESTLGGLPVRPDRKIVISLAAGNRDPRKWDEPEAYDITRNVSGHLGFGRGVHTCVGMHVAKLEAENLLQAFAARVRSVKLARAPDIKLNNTVRGFATLPVHVELDQ